LPLRFRIESVSTAHKDTARIQGCKPRFVICVEAAWPTDAARGAAARMPVVAPVFVQSLEVASKVGRVGGVVGGWAGGWCGGVACGVCLLLFVMRLCDSALVEVGVHVRGKDIKFTPLQFLTPLLRYG
jgi:hypothetical protein